jgi:adenosylcobyric acid synthase
MVLGTSSGAGKSLMTAALCRVLLRRGGQPIPFKGQNMSLNAWVDQDGGEMAYSQALQAWAAGLVPQVAMNPVLLKPQGDSTSEVIHLGRSVGVTKAEHYYRDWFRPGWGAIRAGLQQLQEAYPQGRLVLEGAGSPVEVNLQARDLTNLRLAMFLRARCLLVADIERGGVFAQLVGTLALLTPVQRPLIRGLLINRFRGRRELFDQGREWLEQHTGLPVLGVMPWLEDVFPPEDSLDLLERRSRKPNAELTIAVLRLPSLSNFSDFDPLEAEPSVRVQWVQPGEPIGTPDALILPGSKQTLRDLEALRSSGCTAELQRFLGAGGHLFGICGGLQMLGQELSDPEALEGRSESLDGGTVAGLGLLPLRTQFNLGKALRQRQGHSLWPPGGSLPIQGFELHHGHSTLLTTSQSSAWKVGALTEEPGLGWWSQDSQRGSEVAGTYLHGIFDNGPWRRRWLNQLRRRRGLPNLPEQQPHHSSHREVLLERLADAFEAHVDLTPLLAPP